MGAKQAALACKRFFTFKAVFPCHYGTFPVLDQTADKFVAEMKGERVIVPNAGEGVEV
jgi:L-ascorbate metabolism protein UlaG (beta-lactamase superfamily)